MKREELRIGNYIDNGGEPITVEFWMLDDLSYTLDGYKPIPLTEEWLKKFGFEYSDGVDYPGWFSPAFRYKYSDTFGKLRVAKEDRRKYFTWSTQSFVIVQLKYVHSLQNLYFALTGKELEIK